MSINGDHRQKLRSVERAATLWLEYETSAPALRGRQMLFDKSDHLPSPTAFDSRCDLLREASSCCGDSLVTGDAAHDMAEILDTHAVPIEVITEVYATA